MKKLLIISGVSGAGKTTVSNILEDEGFRCIDQYPIELLSELFELINNDNSYKYEKLAMTISLSDLANYSELIVNANISATVILLDASKDTLINRYKYTRRVHPLLISNRVATLSEAIDVEKGLIEDFAKIGKIIDTTNLSSKDLREILRDFSNEKEVDNLSLSFLSFGYKNGVPSDGDMIFDVRFLDNPFYDVKLKKKNGNQKAVRDFVLGSDLTQEYLALLIKYLDFVIEGYKVQDKRHLTICIGCTGGQHRSVVVANYLYNYYKKRYLCYIKHRELA